jgi:UDP-N-acetylglucosamine diphosphorylase / glucose-1-phosphate thymidylyltransferase / UDP-N-acetylgalactosamine diphosphorylase / glucosamine-1-phosphate N-acetyltransferase / galactosamine-1-phosphate N-acetyltransferase
MIASRSMSETPIRLAVLPAAGRGVRAYPRTVHIPKVLLEVAGKPLLVRNLELLRDNLGIREFIVLIGHLADQIRETLGDGSRFGVHVRFVTVDDPGIGLAKGLYLAKNLVNEPFVTVLGDELYLDSNHRELVGSRAPWEAICAVTQADDPRKIMKNYSVVLDGDRITEVEEKPTDVTGKLLGCGTYVFRPSIFDAIDRTPPSPRSGRVELTDAIRTLIREGKPVLGFRLAGDYFNINSVEDQNYANYLVRSREYARYQVSVIIPAWNEAGSIGAVVKDFLPHVAEVVVADNESTDGTAEIARSLGARVCTKKLRGYGDALRYGLEEAKGDILVLVEADHSFRSKDLGKFLEFMKDADMVIGTRTTRQMVEQGTNMRGIVRWANVIVGKLIEALWWSQEPRFTDVGCTYRAIWRDVYEKIKPRLVGIGPEFSPELMIEVLRQHRRVIEIPVSYYPRLAGESKHSASFRHLAKTATKMLKLVFRKRFLGR